MANREPPKADVLQGTLDLMVLQILAPLGPSHGWMDSPSLGHAPAEAARSRSLRTS
jgi:hypothetical protein